MFISILIGLTIATSLLLISPQPVHAAKKLIEFGWDEPDTRFMRDHVQQMEETPFDGCVFHINYTAADGSQKSFTWESWGKKRFQYETLQDAVEDLKATPFKRLTHNFLRFNVTPGDVDWFEDFSAILSNARLAARIAREGGAKGILFDIEQYNAPLFNYPKLKEKTGRSWEEYRAQVRKRGAELMEAFQAEYPDITIFLTFGYCLPWYQMGGKKDLSEVSYGLLAPLLDGMVEAASEKVVIVDGHESSYGYRDTGRFKTAYQTMQKDLLPIVADREKYSKVFSLGFGVWMDYDWRGQGWDTVDFAKNYYTPEAFEASVRTALEIADEYVWIYTEQPRWWTSGGTREKLPDPYFKAVLRAKQAGK